MIKSEARSPIAQTTILQSTHSILNGARAGPWSAPRTVGSVTTVTLARWHQTKTKRLLSTAVRSLGGGSPLQMAQGIVVCRRSSTSTQPSSPHFAQRSFRWPAKAVHVAWEIGPLCSFLLVRPHRVSVRARNPENNGEISQARFLAELLLLLITVGRASHPVGPPWSKCLYL